MAQFVKNHKQPYEALTKAVSGLPLAGKSFLITGGGSGVGEFITKAIAEAGAAKIAILSRNEKRIKDARDRYATEFPKTTFKAYAVGVNDEAAVAATFADFGVPDVLVNNAGHFPDDGPFVKQDLKSWFSGFEVNVLGTATVTQKFLQAKPESQPAIVINVSSVAAHMRFPMSGWSGYNGSKMAQARIFENIRFEHPEVRFVTIHPGNIASEGFTRAGMQMPPEQMTNGVLAGQFTAWLATPDADFLSGRFVWAEWDIEELKGRKKDIEDGDLLLTTIDGFKNGVL